MKVLTKDKWVGRKIGLEFLNRHVIKDTIRWMNFFILRWEPNNIGCCICWFKFESLAIAQPVILMSFCSVTKSSILPLLKVENQITIDNVGIYWANENPHNSDDFGKKKIFFVAEETHFHLSGYVNKQIPVFESQKTHTLLYRSQCTQ